MTLEQQRAAMAYKDVEEVKDQKERELYGSMAQKLPALIRSAGLCQALHFVKSRKKDPLNKLLDHIAGQLKRVDPEIRDVDSLCGKARKADLAHYVWLTREALATISWYGRLARSEWGVDPTSGDQGAGT
ncbi:MAG TPA: type III-B CRISPR module-associated protein Cmr5 [Thermoanaerobaculia bacterium]